MYPTEFFTNKELNCNCGCGLLPPQEFVNKLYAIRLICGFPLPVTSCARCKTYNPKIGGKEGSAHLPEWDREGLFKGKGGCGVDITIPKKEVQKRLRLVEVAKQFGFKGFGFAETFIHMDDMDRPEIIEWWY